jgi:hypothetical protein
MNRMVKRNIEDVAELVVAAWLVASPLLLGYSARVDATLTSVMIGAILVPTTYLALARPARWEEYFNLALAACLISSPFIFGFTSITVATVNFIATGIVLALICVLALFQQSKLQDETRGSSGAAEKTLFKPNDLLSTGKR